MQREYREHFFLPEHIVYLNASYVSPMPLVSATAGNRAIERRTQEFWDLGATDFFESTEKLRALVAGLWGTLPRNIAIVPSVSYGVESAVKAFCLRPGDEVLLPQDEFPSNVYPWVQAAKTCGSRVVAVARPNDFDWTRAFLERIKPGTKVVSVPLSDWSDGTAFDLKLISQRSREVGARLVVDVSQSFGAIQFSISDFDPDFLFSVGYKWQLGPYGLSYMYVADRWLDACPLENGWLNRKGSEDFSRLCEYRDEYQDGAKRFDAGQRSQFHLTPMALESMKLLREISVTKVQSHNLTLCRELYNGLTSLGFSLPAPERLAGHMLGARHRKWPDMGPLVKRLKERHVYASARGACLRISPHLYNCDQDITRFLEAVAAETAPQAAAQRPQAEL